MNAILLGAASFGALAAIFTGNPSEQDAKVRLELAKAERAAAEQAIGDPGEMKRMTIIDPDTGETTRVSVISFAD